MPRDNYTWARVDCSVLHDPRIMGLPATGFRLYFTAYLLAFEYRSETLPAFCDTRGIANLARLDARTAAKMLQECCRVGLLSLTADNRITVVNAARNGDPRMNWQPPEAGTSAGQTPDVSGTDRQTDRPTDEQTDRQTEQTDPTEAPGAVSESDLSRSLSLLSAMSAAECVRFVSTGSKSKKASSKFLEEAAFSMPEQTVRESCAKVYSLKLAGRLKREPGAMLTALLRNGNGSVPPDVKALVAGVFTTEADRRRSEQRAREFDTDINVKNL